MLIRDIIAGVGASASAIGLFWILNKLIITHALLSLPLTEERHTTIPTNLKAGDLVFFGSYSYSSVLIQCWTSSPYSHCGVIVDNAGTLLYHSDVNSVQLQCQLCGSKDRGVHVHKLEEYLNAKPSEQQHQQPPEDVVHYWQVVRPNYESNKITEELLFDLAKQSCAQELTFNESPINMLRAIIDPRIQPSSFKDARLMRFCSQHVAELWNEMAGECLSQHKTPGQCTPADVLHFAELYNNRSARRQNISASSH